MVSSVASASARLKVELYSDERCGCRQRYDNSKTAERSNGTGDGDVLAVYRCLLRQPHPNKPNSEDLESDLFTGVAAYSQIHMVCAS